LGTEPPATASAGRFFYENDVILLTLFHINELLDNVIGLGILRLNFLHQYISDDDK